MGFTVTTRWTMHDAPYPSGKLFSAAYALHIGDGERGPWVGSADHMFATAGTAADFALSEARRCIDSIALHEGYTLKFAPHSGDEGSFLARVVIVGRRRDGEKIDVLYWPPSLGRLTETEAAAAGLQAGKDWVRDYG